MRIKELGQPGQQKELCERWGHRNVQGDARRGICNQCVRLIDQAYRRTDAFQVQRAGVGQAQACGHALEQGRPQAVFQRSHVLADRALGEAQGFTRPAEVQGFGGSEENAQRRQGVAGAFHRYHFGHAMGE
ncbi:hypothetical protein D3C71_1408680 [compost metagenome]